MIENEKQYKVTLKQLSKFVKERDRLIIQTKTVEAMIDTLQDDLTVYEATNGRV